MPGFLQQALVPAKIFNMQFYQMIKEAAVLSMAAVLLALTVNFLSPVGIPLDRYYKPPVDSSFSTSADPSLPVVSSPFKIMSVSEVKQMVDSGEGFLVDARPIKQYKSGHIPGACPLPLYQMDEYLDSFFSAVTSPVPIVTYCSSLTCEDSYLLAKELADMGYEDIRIFAGGMDAWGEKGYNIVAPKE